MLSIDNLTKTFHGHHPCPKCGSSDNLAKWFIEELQDFTYHCFTSGCTYSKSEAELLRDKRGHTTMYTIPQPTKTVPLKTRGLTEETCQKYNIQVTTDTNELVFPYYRDGELVAAKFRSKAKNFRIEGATKSLPLFGTQTVPSGSRQSVVLTEGEIDAASVYQMTGIPALSIPNGASSASKVVKDNLKYLETFKKVYVCFDNDEAGQEAATSVMNILKSGTGFRVNLTHKDANEYLLAGDANLFKSELKSAQRKTTDVILSKEEVAGLFEDSEETSDGMSTGLTELENCTEHPFLLNQGEVTSLFASASVGKSSVVRQIIANFATRGDRVLFFALEETNKRYLQKVMNMVAGRDIRYGDKLSPDEMNRLSQFAQEYILVANLVDYNWSEIEEAIEYAVRVHDVKLVVFDNITSYISSVPKTIHEAIAETMTGFVRLGKTFGHHTIVVSHTRRDSDLKEGDTPSMTHGYGGGGIERFSDNVVGLGRVQGENETKVKILKHRDNGEVGECTLTWNKNKCSFNEVKQGDKLRPVQVTTPKKETPKVEVKPVEPCLNQGTEKVVSPPTTTTTPIQVRSHKGFPSVDSVELRRTYPSSTLTGKELDP